ncbi:MAG: isoprenyl transferase [bacterium]|nr:isoprenyl transferase [bacterium]
MNRNAIEPLPRHIGIIMDGNGRWANQQAQARVFGHKNATNAVREAVEGCAEAGIEVLTLYAFSTENWKRPQAEIDALMMLFEEYLKAELEGLMKNDIRLVTIGQRERLPQSVLAPLDAAVQKTAQNRRMTLCLAVDYGSRDELTRAMRQLALEVQSGQLDPAQITEASIEARLDTAGFPDPDLIIRTSGELRLSNFMMWQSAYAEYYFTDLLWPDFTRAELERALLDFSKRSRRIGAVHG